MHQNLNNTKYYRYTIYTILLFFLGVMLFSIVFAISRTGIKGGILEFISNYYITYIFIFSMTSLLLVIDISKLRSLIHDFKKLMNKKVLYFFFAFILLQAFLLGAYSLYNDRIDTDEARLLYDAYLAKEGKVPFVDYLSRAPLLVRGLEILVAFFGPAATLSIVQVLIALSMVVSTLLVTLITFYLFRNIRVAIVALFLFAINPLIPNFLHIKTQTFMLPLVLIAILFFLFYIESNNLRHLLSSAIIFGIAHNIRELVFVYMGVCTAYYIIYKYREGLKQLVKNILIFWVIFVILGLSFSVIMSLLSENISVSGAAFSTSFLDLAHIDLERFIHDGIYVQSLVFIPIVYFLYYLNQLTTMRKDIVRDNGGLFILFWFIFLVAAYIYNWIRAGFWGEYYMEFMPVVSIMGALLSHHIFIALIEKIKQIQHSWLAIGIKLILIVPIALILFSILGNMIYVDHKVGPLYTETRAIKVAEFIESKNITIDGQNLILTGDPIYAYFSERINIDSISHIHSKSPLAIGNVYEKFVDSDINLVVEDTYTRIWYDAYPPLEKYVEINFEQIYDNEGVKVYMRTLNTQEKTH